jgi:hypothetical protein
MSVAFYRGGLGGPPPPREKNQFKAVREHTPVLETAYRFMLWLLPTVERLPRTQKFLLGDRIQTLGLDMLESLIEATYDANRQPHLKAANLRIEKLRFLFRMSMDMKYLDLHRYEHAARQLDDIGRQIGGWMKACRGREG